MKNRIIIWLMNFISKKLDPLKLEKYKRNIEYSFKTYLLFFFINIALILVFITSIIFGLNFNVYLFVYAYVLFLVSYLHFKWYSILHNKVQEMLAIKNIFSNIFGGNLGMFEGGEGLLNMLKDLDPSKMPSLDETLSEIKESYDKNVSENDDFLKEIEKNIGEF